MTTPAAPAPASPSPTTRFAVPPFAGPTARASAMPTPAWRDLSVGPYVPKAWRSEAPMLTLASVPSLAPTPIMPMAAIPTPAVTVPVVSGEADASPWTPAAIEPEEPVSSSSGDLPWIDQFLASTPVAPMDAIAGPPDAYRFSTPASVEATTSPPVEGTPSFGAPTVPFAGIPPYVPPSAAPDVPVAPMAAATDAGVVAGGPVAGRPVAVPTPSTSDATADEWPLDEAADALDEITRELGQAEEEHDASPDRLFSDVVVPAPLPAWSDDDMLDIMPVRAAAMEASATRADEAEVAHAASVQAMRDAEARAQADASAQAAAQALELLARRVRAGELQLPGYDPNMGDAAALVSALAALLGLRLG